MPDIVNAADTIVTKARNAGADFADAVIFDHSNVNIEYRLGKKETVERSESAALGLRVIVGQKTALVSTNNFNDTQIDELVDRCLGMARVAPDDPFLTYSKKEDYITSFPDLDLCDAEEPSIERLAEMAEQAESSALDVEGITNSEGGSASHSRNSIALVTSEGFNYQYHTTTNSLSVCVLAGKDTNMERDYDYSSKRFLSDLKAADAIGKKAAEKTLKRLGAKQAKTGQYPVVYCNELSGKLVGYLGSAINGVSVSQGTSFLKDAMDSKLFSDSVHIVDDPHIKRGLASKVCDVEGIESQKLDIIKDGILSSWLLDLRSAKKLGLKTTGHANRGISSTPSPSSSNLYMQNGTLSLDELIADIKEGFFVTDTFGMGVNLVTGDYSQGANGFWIENGNIAYPVNEITIAGNLKDMFKMLTPANDLEFHSSTNAPSVRIESMTVAGK